MEQRARMEGPLKASSFPVMSLVRLLVTMMTSWAKVDNSLIARSSMRLRVTSPDWNSLKQYNAYYNMWKVKDNKSKTERPNNESCHLKLKKKYPLLFNHFWSLSHHYRRRLQFQSSNINSNVSPIHFLGPLLTLQGGSATSALTPKKHPPARV